MDAAYEHGPTVQEWPWSSFKPYYTSMVQNRRNSNIEPRSQVRVAWLIWWRCILIIDYNAGIWMLFLTPPDYRLDECGETHLETTWMVTL